MRYTQQYETRAKETDVKRRSLITLLLLLFAACALLLPLNQNAMSVHDEAFGRSVGAFAIAKGLNAVISLIQGTELNATPAGVGITITVGEILDPMNDLVERFSWIMLAASVSLGVQKILLSVGELFWIKMTLTALLVAVGASLWFRPLQRRLPLSLLLRLTVVVALLRFGAAGFVYAEQLVYTSLMQPQYNASVAVLDTTRDELDTIARQSKQQAAAKDESLLDSLSGSYDRMKNFFDIDARLDAMKTQLEQAQKEVVNLMTIFVTLNILLPLLFLWTVLGLFKWTVTGRFDTEALQRWIVR